MKVAKEEIVGLLTALEMFVEEDEEGEMKRYSGMAQMAVDGLVEVPGLAVTVEHDEYDYLIPSTVIRFGRE